VGERRWKTAPDEQVQPSKTLWDLLQLLIVPAILIAVTFAWSASQTRSDNKREDRRIAADRAAAEEARRDTTLEAYLTQMSALMLDRRLRASKNGDEVRSVARTVTLATLRRLDGKRKGEVVEFLNEAELLKDNGHPASPPVNLEGANLTGADLTGADLTGANFTRADLTGAILTSAFLTDANLTNAILVGASLSAILVSANLTSADLTGANLTSAMSHPGFDGDFVARVRLAEGEVCHVEITEVPGGAAGACYAVGVRVGAAGRACRG
jgi:hypothetical protein